MKGTILEIIFSGRLRHPPCSIQLTDKKSTNTSGGITGPEAERRLEAWAGVEHHIDLALIVILGSIFQGLKKGY